MTVSIDQFMWPFQRHFRRRVEYEFQRVLSQIGFQASKRAKVLLIGLATEDDLRHEICIEPENGPLVVDDLRSIEERTEEIHGADPESGMSYSDARIGEYRRRGLFLRSRAQAIAEAIEASGKFEGLKFFVSNSAPVDGYDVHTCVGISSDELEFVPSFNNPMRDDYRWGHVKESFIQQIIDTCLGRADRALYLPNPGEDLGVLGDTTDIVRNSAERFVQGITFALTPLPSDIFIFANEVSSLTYERSGARGRIAMSQPENLTNKLKVTFRDPVRLGETRSVRKILELSDESTYLLADNQLVYGLGECNSAPDVAKIVIEGHAKWSVSVDDTTLIRVSYEHATLPTQILDKEVFKDICERTVGAVGVERIWNTFQYALDSGHGTTIVVSEDPVSELERLAQEALSIKPEYLARKDVTRLGRVDGAIVLGPDGRCYAFGVILDGMASSSGDRSRGARFNSSVRYQETSRIGTAVIIISDDGTVDLIPNLMARVWRQEVEDAVQAFCEYSGMEDADGEEWAIWHGRVKALAFYLNQDQCDRVNESYEREMDARLNSGDIGVIRDPLQPSPGMNDSYFWDS